MNKNNSMNKKQYILVIGLIALGLITRLAWHPANTTALAAISLASGFYFSKKLAWLIPAIVMFISNIFLGSYELPVMISVYLSFIAVTYLGSWLKTRASVGRLVVAIILPATLFFVVTNVAVWLFTPWYVKTLGGLVQSLIAGLPFWRNMLMGDAVWISSFAVGYYIISHWSAVFSQVRVWYTKST